MSEAPVQYDLEGAARKGAALLDERLPGWADRINIDTLDVSDGFVCVLAQATGGHYSEGLHKLGLSFADGPRYGFAVEADTPEEGVHFTLLTDYWYAEITARLEKEI